MAPPRDHAGGGPIVVVHGGAGADPGDGRDELRAGMTAAALAGWRALAAGGHALDAVEAAVRALEDHPRFNAGRGSVLTADGTVEMDASIMEGDRLACGAVAAVSRVANPITLARRVMEDERHVLLVAEGAHAFARAVGMPECDPASLVTDRQRARLAAAPPAGSRGTVGAVALDGHGTIAAATSTGGMVGKRPGRVGDSALIGCGTYADSAVGGVSCTGSGEAIIRVVLARRALDLLAAGGDPDAAARTAVELLVKQGRGEGGLILVDAQGRVGHASSTALMPVAWMAAGLDAPAFRSDVTPPLDAAAVEAARHRLRDAVYETPCAYSQTLSELTGTRCYVKLENLQMTGSFKERGAANLLLQLDPAERRRGVAAASAGNHGLAVAFHAARLGIPATIVMPTAAPLIKVTSARRYGADVILYGDNYDEAYERAQAVAVERDAVFVHPFDDARIVAGQGTLGLELLEQVEELDAVLVPVGGGGLIAGVALAIKARRPDVRVIGVQSAAVPAMVQALGAGGRVRVPAGATIADGIAVRQVGAVTYDLVARLVDGVVTVDEEELANAVLLLLEIEKTVVEGAGATPLAALLNRPLGLHGGRVVLVLSGGNIDVTMLSRIIERGLVKDGRLVRLRVVLQDRPGALARLTALIAEERANIVHIEHDRAFSRLAIGATEVELTLETAGRKQIDTLKQRLESAGYTAEERGA